MKYFIILFFIFFGPLAALAATSTVNLPVPFTSEAPDGLMVGNWKNACEEASIVMVEQYYFGNSETNLTKSEAKNLMTGYFTIENKIFGSNANANAAQINKLLTEYSPYATGTIARNPTLTQIKNELTAGRPVIVLVYGKGLNSRIDFLAGGSYYHTFVIRGFDDTTGEFIVNDDGDLTMGLDLRYKYDTILGALHDYNYATHKTDGAPTVIFTKQRILAKTADSGRIYLISDNTRQHITAPSVFKNHGWKWSLVQTVTKNWLNKFKSGVDMTQ